MRQLRHHQIEVGRGLGVGIGTDFAQDGAHAVRMLHGGLAGFEHHGIDQRQGVGPRLVDPLVCGLRLGGATHCDGLIGAHDSKKSRTMPTWSGCTSVGACPTPASSTRRALGPRCVIASAVCTLRMSESAPLTTRVGAAICS